jgi:hypothetical protein
MTTPWYRQLWYWITFTPARKAAASVAAVVLAAAVAFGGYTFANPAPPPPPNLACGVGVARPSVHSTECEGVTDGGYVFAPELKAVEAKILKQNQYVAGQHPATVALLMPMTSSDGSVQAEVLHAVEGAYAAQYRADNLDDNTVPKIRLVLANPGSDSSGWLAVDRELSTMTGAPDYLRVVAGISDSTEDTQAEVHWLTHLPDPVPVVGGSITADTIANTATSQPFPGLARVSATNTAEAAALARFAKVDPRQAMVVEDTRTDDDYITTLKQAISKQLGTGMAQPVQFTSPADISQDGDTQDQFDQKVLNICMAAPRYIYFAGRHVQLRQFLNALGQGCPEGRFTVLTGDDASHLSIDKELNPADFGHGITLEYAALAFPDAWTKPPVPATGGSTADYDDFLHAVSAAGLTLGRADLTDGQAIVAHDAVWTAAQALQHAHVSGQVLPPSLAAVGQEWQNLHAELRVDGASGWICLDNGGNPWDKAVPMISYDGRTSTFLGMAWPTGAPPAADCTPQAGEGG